MDSGADETLLPRSIGEAIGVRIDDSTQSQVAGIGGQLVDVWYGQADMELTAGRKSYRWSAVVAFTAMEPEDTSAILGHAGCINFFRVRFDVERRAVHLQPNGKFMGNVI